MPHNSIEDEERVKYSIQKERNTVYRQEYNTILEQMKAIAVPTGNLQLLDELSLKHQDLINNIVPTKDYAHWCMWCQSVSDVDYDIYEKCIAGLSNYSSSIARDKMLLNNLANKLSKISRKMIDEPDPRDVEIAILKAEIANLKNKIVA